MPALVLAQFLALAGCATPDTRPVPEDRQLAWQQHRQQLETLGRWEMRARIAVRVGDDGGQANLHWNHREQDNDMRLVGAWGKGLLRLSFDQGHAELTDEFGQTVSGPDAGELLFRATGWIVPVSNLNAWMVGRPLGEHATTHLDRFGRLSSVLEDGWKIEYLEYRQFGRWELPRKLTLSQQQPLDGERSVSVRMVVNSWQVGS
jgi:outer membrane lipoprotein LolB